ncbi:MAG TPA: AraC family transcriptional regulator [Candidatus Limnocylindrales bacterium]
MAVVPLFTLPALRRAHDLIDLRYAEPLDLDDLAREAGYSKYHFARAFASAYGESPRAYLTRRRLERAKTLLRTANLTVTEVCFTVGFQSLGSFSSLFRRVVGQTPSGYQRMSARSNGPPPIPGCVVMMWTRPTASGSQARRSLPNAASPIVDGVETREDPS